MPPSPPKTHQALPSKLQLASGALRHVTHSTAPKYTREQNSNGINGAQIVPRALHSGAEMSHFPCTSLCFGKLQKGSQRDFDGVLNTSVALQAAFRSLSVKSLVFFHSLLQTSQNNRRSHRVQKLQHPAPQRTAKQRSGPVTLDWSRQNKITPSPSAKQTVLNSRQSRGSRSGF